jgi:ABC-type phosphate transport system substrate-binding protein
MTTTTSFRTLALLLLAAGATRPTAAAPPTAYTVVVNAANPTSSLSRIDTARLFLKKVTAWPDGRAVAPVDQTRTAAVRQAFSADIHQKDADAISAHWQVLVFSGRDVPPRILRSDDEVLAYVRANPGAIGYVSPTAALDAGVKKVTIQ